MKPQIIEVLFCSAKGCASALKQYIFVCCYGWKGRKRTKTKSTKMYCEKTPVSLPFILTSCQTFQISFHLTLLFLPFPLGIPSGVEGRTNIFDTFFCLFCVILITYYIQSTVLLGEVERENELNFY